MRKGNIYNKEKAKVKLINAVSKILKNDGFHKVKVTKVEKIAGAFRSLTYRYFGSPERLMIEYLHQMDFWKIDERKLGASSTNTIRRIENWAYENGA